VGNGLFYFQGNILSWLELISRSNIHFFALTAGSSFFVVGLIKKS
jgi:hypothetical protein